MVIDYTHAYYRQCCQISSNFSPILAIFISKKDQDLCTSLYKDQIVDLPHSLI